ncbi:MAG: DIP1984 family protein [Bacteroidales bacterium]|nr:DIP1984 family protein [Bacteroidales bacterium]
MKLAEALSIRKDLMKRIAQLQGRIANNVKVQEGDEPLENPDELMKELDSCLKQLEDIIFRINATNMKTKNAKGVTLTQLMAQRDVLTMRVNTIRNVFNSASESQNRYSQSEIKMVTVVDVKKLGKKVDDLSAKLRVLDMEIQALNFSADLI